MPTYPFTTVDVFTTQRYTGNPLAIVQLPTDHDLSTEKMLQVAREFNLSETVFLHPTSPSPNDAELPEYRLRIFMTAAELPFAGHPTIGSACHALGTLSQGAKKGRLICNAGPVDVDFTPATGVARAGIPHHFHRHTEHAVEKKEIARLQPGISGVESVDVVSPVKGMNFVAVRLASIGDLDRVGVTGVKPRVKLDRDWDVGFCGLYFYVVTDAEESVVKVRTRMIEGNMEDPATGSAACGLSCFLALDAKGRGMVRFEIVQGVEMGSKSEIGVEVTLKEHGGEVENVVLSGSAVGVMEGRIEI